jgi:hypothetical protein
MLLYHDDKVTINKDMYTHQQRQQQAADFLFAHYNSSQAWIHDECLFLHSHDSHLDDCIQQNPFFGQ